MEGQSAALDGSELTPEQVKELRDTLKRELAKTQGARDNNTIVVKAATQTTPETPKVSAASKGFSKPPE
jgi:hypothetical protein